MRNLIVTNITSLDGYLEGPGGTSWLPMDPSFGAYNAERLQSAGTPAARPQDLRAAEELLAARGGRSGGVRGPA